MTCTRHYECDLCHRSVDRKQGVGLYWITDTMICATTYYANREHHLCNQCLTGLRSMFAELDKTAEMHRQLYAPETDAPVES